MRAVWMREFGAPAVLRPDVAPRPEVGGGQLLIDVEASSITFVETMVRAGKPPRPEMTPALPVILGNGVGGVVSAVGRGMDRSWLGRRVVSTTGGSGGYAEQAAVDRDWMVAVPDAVSTIDATALLADGRTAVALTMLTAPAAGEWVLVEAAAGGVGSLLVQLSAAAGARVIAAASSLAKRNLALELGAVATVDYTDDGWAGSVMELTGGAGVDVIFDGVGGEVARGAATAVADGGRFVVHGASSGAFASADAIRGQGRGVSVLGMTDMRSLGLSAGQLTDVALRHAMAGRLRPVVGQTFALDHAADAHAAVETRRAIGKTLLLPRAL